MRHKGATQNTGTNRNKSEFLEVDINSPLRILVVSDMLHPYIYRDAFPIGLEPLDLVLAAGDLPGYYLEFIATRLTCPVVYVHGNHGEEYVKDYLGHEVKPGGVIDAHGRVISITSGRARGLRILGWGGTPRYSEHGPGQYSSSEIRLALMRLQPQFWFAGRRKLVDILLTHAPPSGPHAGHDFAHRGCLHLEQLSKRLRPGLHEHGHVHTYEGHKPEYTTQDGVRVINAFGYQVLEFLPRWVLDETRQKHGLQPEFQPAASD